MTVPTTTETPAGQDVPDPVRRLLGREPALWLALVAVLVQTALPFLGLSPDQQSLVNAFVVAAIGFVTAFFVVGEKQVPAVLGLVKAAIALGVGLGLGVTAHQQAVVMSVVTAVGALVTRSQVTAPVTASGQWTSFSEVPPAPAPGEALMTTTLPGTDVAVPVGDLTIHAPGLGGTAAPHDGRLPDDDLARAVANAGMAVRAAAAVIPTSAPDDRATVSAGPRSDRRAVLLVRDPSGAVSWHVPESAAGDVRFRVAPRRLSPARGAGPTLLSVLDFPVGTAVGEDVATAYASWEQASRHPVATWFPPRHDLQDGVALSNAAWRGLAGAPTLLFVHGIFSSCASGFAGLTEAGGAGVDDLWAGLARVYGDRIIGYDHPTASVTPEQNAADFLALIPDGVHLDLDVVCHSRGGLVARILAGQLPGATPDPSTKVTVRRIVFAGTPNGGTDIVDPGHWNAVVDRFTTLLSLAPPQPWRVATVPLEAILELVKVIAEGGEPDLPGLSAMAPGSDLYQALDRAAGPSPQYYAIEADFEPNHVLRHLFDATDDVLAAADPVIDGVFDNERNDIAVPTAGVSDPASVGTGVTRVNGFPVSADHLLSFAATDGVWHSSYFDHPRTRAALLTWLGGQPVER